MTDPDSGAARAAPPLRHRLEYLGFSLFRGVFLVLPESLALALGEVLGWAAGVVFRVRRDVVDENLERAFPGESRAWRNRVAVRSFRHLGRESVATFRLARQSAEDVVAATDVEAIDRVRQAIGEGKGMVVATGHFGNWEVAGAAYAARGVPVHAVVQVQRNRRFDDDLREARERLGMKVIPKQVAPRAVLKALRQGGFAALVADQNVRQAGIFIDFFGVPAATARGPAVFALRSGAPLWVSAAVRVSRRPQRYRLLVEEIDVELTGDMETDTRLLTEAHTEVLERWIREYPDQYFWQHKRWKTRPPIPEPESAGDDIRL